MTWMEQRQAERRHDESKNGFDWRDVAGATVVAELDPQTGRPRTVDRGGEKWVRTFTSHELLELMADHGPDGVEYITTTGRLLRSQLPPTVGILHVSDVDTEHQVSPPEATPVVRVATQ